MITPNDPPSGAAVRDIQFRCDGCQSTMILGPVPEGVRVCEIASTVCPVCDDGRMDPIEVVARMDEMDTIEINGATRVICQGCGFAIYTPCEEHPNAPYDAQCCELYNGRHAWQDKDGGK